MSEKRSKRSSAFFSALAFFIPKLRLKRKEERKGCKVRSKEETKRKERKKETKKEMKNRVPEVCGRSGHGYTLLLWSLLCGLVSQNMFSLGFISVRSAAGKVLVIDEAYNLDDNLYGKQAKSPRVMRTLKKKRNKRKMTACIQRRAGAE